MTNENFYKEIIKQSPFGYFYGKLIKDNQGKVADIIILDINNKFENIVNLKEEDIIGKSILDIIRSINSEYLNLFTVNSTDQFIECLGEYFKVNIISNDEKYVVVQLFGTCKEELFIKTLIDSLPFAAWAKDKEGRHVIVNKKYEEDTGLSSEEIKGKTDFEIWPIDIANQFKEEDNAAMINKNIKQIYKFDVNGEWYELYKYAVNDDKGNTIGTIGFSLNVNSEQRIKSEIEKNNKLLKTLIDCIPDFIFYKDLDGKYMTLNQSLTREYFGKDENELIGKRDIEIIHDSELLESFKVQDKELIKDGEIKSYEETLKLLDGSVRQYETIKSPFFDENNEVIGIIGISRDITNRKVSGQKLKESEEKFRQLTENIDGIFLMIENGKLMYISPGYEKIFGRSEEDLYKDPMSILNYIHEEDKELFINVVGNEYIDEKFRIVKPDGTVRWIWSKSFPIKDENGELVRIVGIGQDITAIKEAEIEIDRLRTEFFANLSHEFRTPLNLMFSSLQMIELKLSKCPCENKFSFEKYTNIIKQNSFRLLRLVNNLIDSTKVDAGYVECCRENHDIVSYVKNICNSVSGFAMEKDIELVFNSELEEKIISFDLDKMERIILNLISNAIKFNIHNGKIEVFIVPKENFIEIHVKDTGIGIARDKISYVFERFKQVNNRLTKVSEGSGIGLSLVKSLVEMQGGTIEANSNVGEGTEFIVKLPDTLLNEYSENVCKNQIKSNSRVERVQIEFSDIYGLSI